MTHDIIYCRDRNRFLPQSICNAPLDRHINNLVQLHTVDLTGAFVSRIILKMRCEKYTPKYIRPLLLLEYKIIHNFSNLSCHKRHLTPCERYLIYHKKPITQAPRSISSDVSSINHYLVWCGGKTLAILHSFKQVSFSCRDASHKVKYDM